MKDPVLTNQQFNNTRDQFGDGCGYNINGHTIPVGPTTKVSYAATLEKGDHCYLWSGDVRRGASVSAVDKPSVTLVYWGKFNRRTGKNESGMYIGNAAGEYIIDVVPSVAEYAKEGSKERTEK